MPNEGVMHRPENLGEVHWIKIGGEGTGFVDLTNRQNPDYETVRLHAVRELVVRHRGKYGVPTGVVISGFAGETDQSVGLIRHCAAGNRQPPRREENRILAIPEIKTAAALAICLDSAGEPAKSLTGPEVPIITERLNGNDYIREVGIEHLTALLKEGVIPVVTGFQGVDRLGNVTTLGRGGSDLTVMAVTGAFKRAGYDSRAFLYKMESGVMTANPKVVTNARVIPHLSHREMIALSENGGKVVQTRCAKLAENLGIIYEVRSAKNIDQPGTVIGG